MTNFFSTLCLFLFISSLILILIYYIYKVADFFPGIRFGKITLVYWLIVLLLGIIFFSIKYSTPSYTKIACFPLANENVEMNSAVADRVNQILTREYCSESKSIVYNLQNTFEIFDIDSASKRTYLINIGEKINLDYLLLINTTTRYNNTVVNLSIINYKKDKIQQFTDTLNFNKPQKFFTNLKKDIDYLVPGDISLKKNELLGTQKQWQKYGKGIWTTLQDKFMTADTIFSALLKELPENNAIKKQYASILIHKSLQFKSEGKFFKDIIDHVFSLLNQPNYSEADSDILKLLGKMYVHNQNWNFAALKLKQALKLNPNDAEIYFYLSKLHPSRMQKTGSTSKIKLLKKSIFLNPAYVTPHLKLAQIYLKRREFKKAKRIYKHILSLNSRSIDALHGLGKMYLIQNEPVDFINTYKKILSIDPINSIAFYNLGIAYLNTKDIDRAEDFFRRSIEIDNYSNSYFYLGVIYALKRNPDKAIFNFSKSIETGNNDEYIREAHKAIRKLKNNEEIIHLRSFHGFGRQ